MNIWDDYIDDSDTLQEKTEFLQSIIYNAFQIEPNDDDEIEIIEEVEIVYPKRKVTEMMISALFEKFMKIQPYKEKIEINVDKKINISQTNECEDEGKIENIVEESGYKGFIKKPKKYRKNSIN